MFRCLRERHILTGECLAVLNYRCRHRHLCSMTKLIDGPIIGRQMALRARREAPVMAGLNWAQVDELLRHIVLKAPEVNVINLRQDPLVLTD